MKTLDRNIIECKLINLLKPIAILNTMKNTLVWRDKEFVMLELGVSAGGSIKCSA